ncbi:acyl-CoA oxidase [Dothidotthia symphoricarpi CBS 119687]|uniref:Acyl-coenzyme A oxidase n=1 Tax=Dothidotthia symphoricarpi CBS 119687 TaxID=1392245 RepID=A0A6A5ZV48_9PLEO|nr:acyl-CoA oxidase [Dothidotthia symphoricarpi CBS 119687]KAF2123520.1 acyl-CoA oxidase [Dothidotthia symphoricarpi CBS 119687]
MQTARASASFDTFELTCLLWGGEDNVRQRSAAFKRVEKLLGTHDTTKLPRCYADTDRESLYEQGLHMGKVILEDMMRYNHDVFVSITPRYNLINASPFGHQGILFEPAIEHNGTEEQKAQWLPLAKSGKILGTYAQTELGHGSFVRGVETTATFDAEMDEFVIHSPTVSSTKFWPAGLGFSTTHGVVMAKLLVDGKDLGPHLFVMQLRCVEDGRPMPGIKMGDIGLKMGYNEADNGFASFNYVRIPRTQMLMAHSQLSSSGVYTKTPLRQKLSYSVMLLVRSKMAGVFTAQLAQAVTIATRYSVVREQGLGPQDAFANEASIMRYKSQHFRLLSLIAKSYAMHFASLACEDEYHMLREMQAHDDHDALPPVHALTAGMKAYVTGEAADGGEEARKLCGGHGYMNISGLPDILGALAGGATFEGENYVLWQQVGRYLLKQVDALQQGEAVDAQVQYLTSTGDLSTPCLASTSQFLDVSVQLSIYRHRAHCLVLKAHRCVRSSRKTPADAWNEHMMTIISASRAHMEYLVLESFVAVLARDMSPSLHAVLTHLCSLFALSTIINPRSVDALAFVETTNTKQGYLSTGQLDDIRALVNDLLEQLLPEAVALTDAWGFSDASLCSAIGMFDGNVYENVMKWVEQLPMNKRGGVPPKWGKYVDPILKGKNIRAKL